MAPGFPLHPRPAEPLERKARPGDLGGNLGGSGRSRRVPVNCRGGVNGKDPVPRWHLALGTRGRGPGQRDAPGFLGAGKARRGGLSLRQEVAKERERRGERRAGEGRAARAGRPRADAPARRQIGSAAKSQRRGEAARYRGLPAGAASPVCGDTAGERGGWPCGRGPPGPPAVSALLRPCFRAQAWKALDAPFINISVTTPLKGIAPA